MEIGEGGNEDMDLNDWTEVQRNKSVRNNRSIGGSNHMRERNVGWCGEGKLNIGI